MLVKRLALTVFVLLSLAFFAVMVVAMNVISAVWLSGELVWDVGSRVLGNVWNVGGDKA